MSGCENADCSKSIINLLLRAQFIRGLSDSDIREKILQQADVTFDKTLEIALAIESSKIENKEVYKSYPSSSGINKISHFNKQKTNQRFRSNSKSTSRKNERSISRNRNTLNLRELGLENVCLHCGKNNHKTQNCRIKHKLKCQFCSKLGHTGRVCISELLKRKSPNEARNNVQHIEDNDINEFQISQIVDVCTNSNENDYRIFANVQLNNDKNIRFECDSGSRLSIMNINEFKNLQINTPILNTNVFFRSYTGEIFKPVGFVKINVRYKEHSSQEELYLIDMQKEAILGRNWIRKLKINLSEINKLNNFKQISLLDIQKSISNITKEYFDVFEQKVGQIPDYICSLKLRKEATPVFIKSRQIPYALKESVDKELDKLEADGIIEKVEHSEWGTPLVVVPKKDGNVRLCADYKVTVNKQLLDARHPIPRIEDIFNKLRDGSYFCTLDIYKAYLHLLLDEESAKIQTISTHRGTYIVKRLNFGIKTAPNEFHSFIDQFVQELEGVVAYFDDLIIQGKTYEECKSRLIKVLNKLRKYNLHVNINKCKFFQKSVEYLGHIISAKGLSKTPGKIEAIQNVSRPNNVDELRKFLGLIMYYSKFIPNASDLLYPLNRLLRKGIPFKWTSDCEAAWIKAKSEIASDRVLIPFNPNLPVTLATDASPYGLSAILSHILPDGSERPIAFASRSLTAAEKNYSQLDREATAVYWAFKKYYDYIYGRKFTLIVDNKPMMTILHPEKKLPVLSASRMLRYAHFISGFDYKIIYRKSTDHTNVDYLSRNPLPLIDNEVQIVDDEYIFQESIIRHISTETITADEIRKETLLDQELSQIRENLLNGNLRDPEITIQNGILLRGQRVIIPKKLQPHLLQELHSTHVGIVKMKALARNYCYWKNIDSDIENLAKSCKSCCNVKKNPQKAPVHNWDIPEKNWQRIHIDYAGPFMGHFFFLVIDAKSKWPEIFATKKNPDSALTINFLREIFSRQGLPEILVSDNATLFKSEKFTDFCKRNGIRQRLIAPGHPSTNGQVERYCQTLKTKLKCMQFQPGTLHEKLHELLFRYRATPLSCGKTPAELLYGQNLRTKLDLIKPISPDYFKNKAEQPDFQKRFRVGDRVQSRNYANSTLWKFGTIVEQLGRVHYLVELDDGYVIKRHYDQLRVCQVNKELTTVPSEKPVREKMCVTFSDHVDKREIPARRHATEPPAETIITPHAIQPSNLRVSPPEIENNAPETTERVLRRSVRIRKPVDRLNYKKF